MASCVNFGQQYYFGFDPRTLPGCSLWLDAADARTLTTNVSGKVTQWQDKSVRGLTLTPVGANSNATLQSNYRNGLTALNFSGLNQYRSASNTGVYPSDVYILVALKSLVRTDVISIGAIPTDSFNSLTFSEYTALRWHNGSSGFSRTPNTVSPTNETSTSLLLMNWSIANANFVLRRNGTQLSSTASYSYSLPSGSAIQIGFRHPNLTTSLAFNAYVAEVVAFNRQLSIPERQQVEGYLAWKWALTSNLPTGHPFKPTPPAMRVFLPTDISGGPLVWLDAADATTITGSPVTQWVDKSGQGSSATTGIGSVVAGSPLNSQNTLRFGLSNTLTLSNLTMPSSQTSVFYIFKGITSNADTAAGTGYFLFSRVADDFTLLTGNEQFFSYQNPATGRSYVAVMGPGGERNWGNLSTTTAFANAVSVISTAGISYASSNGLSLSAVASCNVSNTVATATTYQIGTTRSVGDVYTYDLGELIVYNGTASTAMAQQLEGYLAWKWGVQGSLPNTHPYSRVLPSTPRFYPSQLPGLALWLDAADTTTITLSGSNVTAWNDKSSNARNATGGVSPTTATNGVVFDGTSQYLTTTYSAVPSAESFFCVTTWTGATDRNYCIIGTSAANGRDFNVQQLSGVNTIRWDAWGVGSWAATSGVQSGVPFLASGIFTGTSGQTALNGGPLSTSESFSFSGTGTTNIGAGVLGDYYQGTINEIVVYSSTLGIADRQKVEGYLAWKWGVQSNLPTTHAYWKFTP